MHCHGGTASGTRARKGWADTEIPARQNPTQVRVGTDGSHDGTSVMTKLDLKFRVLVVGLMGETPPAVQYISGGTLPISFSSRGALRGRKYFWPATV